MKNYIFYEIHDEIISSHRSLIEIEPLNLALIVEIGF